MRDIGVDASRAADDARGASQQLRRHRGYPILVSVGLISYGVVHVLIAWLALRIAWGGGGDASQQGALRTIAKTGVGPVLLVVVAVGMVTLALWQAVEAFLGSGRVAQQRDERRRTWKRLSSAGRSLVYLVLGVSAFRL